jgi:hypothetical protein
MQHEKLVEIEQVLVREVKAMKLVARLLVSFVVLSPPPISIKGAVVGGVAGHYAGHRALLGGIAGCAVGGKVSIICN